MAKPIREWVSVCISLLALALSAGAYYSTCARDADTRLLQANDLLDRGWDGLDGVIHDFSQDKVEQACRDINRAVEILPEYSRGLRYLGTCSRVTGDLDKAAEAYSKAIALDGDDVIAHAGLGAVLLEQGHLDRAIVEAQEAIRLEPDYSLALDLLGQVFFRQSKLEEAARAFQPALDQKYPPAFAHYGLVLLAQDHPTEAVKAFRTAVQLDPSSAETHRNLGMALYYSEQLDPAERELRQSIQLDPADAAAHRYLAAALRRQGRVPEADEIDAKAAELERTL